MRTISLCMIVRDEEPVLERCLKSAALFADEIIIVDTGSSDSTKQIAKKYTNRVYEWVWKDDFAAARNVSYSYATKDYIMWLDADDDIGQESIDAICALKNKLTDDVDVVAFVYGGDIEEQIIQGNDYVMRDRLIKRSLNPQWQFPIHEVIPILPQYHVLYAEDICVLHRKKTVNDPLRNMRIFENMKRNHVPLNALNRYYYCRELYLAANYTQCLEEYNKLSQATEVDEILDALPFAIWSLHKLNDTEGALTALLAVLRLVPPDEFICCELGNCFLKKRLYMQAEFWYQQALATKVDLRDLRPHFLAYQKFLPYLKLGVLFANQGDFDIAIKHNECALQVFPNNVAAKCNQLYYQKQIGTVT